ncbi:Prophage minor tail protein Z (GPZ) [Azotobacter beijerinckii]|uniref:Prophage minor tail protein Z (GPZ) n=1 Tax=Azotobacter beijerinckii TaxID=170623 RepID=A0A1H9JWH9_9GAMM|nr:phage tail protein [Azotobacter beijerinckii]SEQ91189.1 Prophage minor tail protein Z (GPZ) [Azotobacter beijerinckii]
MSVRVGFRGGREALKRLEAVDEKAKRAVLMATNDTGETLRAQILREMGAAVNIKRNTLRERVILTRAASWSGQVRIWARRKGLVLSHFPHRQLYRKQKKGKRRRAGVQVNVSGRTRILPGAFIVESAGSGSTNGLIFIRTGKRSKAERLGMAADGGDLSRTKIQALYGPSPSQILNSKLPDYQAAGQRILREEIVRQLKRTKL